MYRLNIKALRKAAAAKGDKTGYAIAKRTGLSQSVAYRILNGTVQPGANTLLRLCTTYGTSADALMDRIEDAA